MIHIAIVEDEEKIRNQLYEYIKKYEKEKSSTFEISIFQDGDEILDNYCADYDIILLDIQMKRLNGMETAEKIRLLDEAVNLIFITNLAQYAIRGYGVNAIGFVLKPISYVVFSREISKAISKLKKDTPFFLSIQIDSGVKRLNISEITYIESFGHRLQIHTLGDEYVISGTMKLLEQKLKDHHFYRCNNSYIVNMAYVESVKQNIVTVQGQKLQISRPKKKLFMETLTDYMGGVLK